MDVLPAAARDVIPESESPPTGQTHGLPDADRTGADAGYAVTLSLAAGLADLTHRSVASQCLARHLGAHHLLVCAPDPDLGTPLVALGFPQTLPDGRRWRVFFAQCQRSLTDVVNEASLRCPYTGEMQPVVGVTAPGGALLVLIGGTPVLERVADVVLVLPLLSGTVAAERRALVAAGNADVAQESAVQARRLATTLDATRRDLEKALNEMKAVDLERQRAVQALREETETLETLNRLGPVIAAELDLEKLVQAVTDAATDLSGAQFGAFFYQVANRDGEYYTLYAISGVPREQFTQFSMPRNTALFGPTFRGEAVVRLDDVTKDPRYGQNAPNWGMPAGHLPVVSYLAVPVLSRSGEVLGGLFFGHKQPGVFTERAERIVVALAAMAAVAVDNARLYRAAQEARERVEALAIEREQFLAAASHDLKNPLAAARGNAQLLHRMLTRTGTVPIERLAPALVNITTSLDRMTDQVNELLDIARARLGQPLGLERAPTDLVALARQLVALHQATTDRHHLRVEESISELVGEWDAGRLQRVLGNLLSNAVKYSPDGGEIVITVAREPGDSSTAGAAAHEPAPHETGPNAWAVLCVQDEGVGIPAADMDRIFDRFQRGSNVTGRIEGTGLGLAAARQVVEQHGGAIIMESIEGTGTKVTVRLPITTLD